MTVTVTALLQAEHFIHCKDWDNLERRKQSAKCLKDRETIQRLSGKNICLYSMNYTC